MSDQSRQVLDWARGNLLSYCSLMDSGFEQPSHVKKIARVLHAVERGEKKRVIITIAPRHGKSETASRYFPPWYMGRHPDQFMISCTYGQDLSDDFGRKVRDQLADPLHHEAFPLCNLRRDSRSVQTFQTEEGGIYFGVGVGGPITGRGAHVLLIDDPTKNREDAESDTKRKKLQEWYKSVVYPRLMPGGAIVVIMQRWNQQDFAGYLLKEHAHENWEVIDMPAIDENDKALWPERYPLSVLLHIKKTVGPYIWSSQYLQKPISKDSIILDFTKITSYEKLPKIVMKFMTCDPAISKEKKSANTSFCILGFGSDGHIYDLETTGHQLGFEETLTMASGIIKRHRPQYFGVEDNGYQKALFEVCNRYFPLIQVLSLHSDKDKFRRAKTISHIISKGLFHTNNEDLINEIINFDPEATGEFRKDRVDAMVMGLHLVQKYAPLDLNDGDVSENSSFEGMDSHQAFFKQTREYEKKQRELESNPDQFVQEFSPSETPVDPDFY